MMKNFKGFLLIAIISALASCGTGECVCTENDGTQTSFGENDISSGTIEEACEEQDQINKSANIGSCEIL